MRSRLSQRLGWLGSPSAHGEQGQPCPGWLWPLGSGQTQHPLNGGRPTEGAPLTALHARGLQGAASGVLGFVRAGAMAGRGCRTGWGRHYVSPRHPSCYGLSQPAVLPHCTAPCPPAWHVPEDGDSPLAAWIQRSSEVWCLPGASGM